MSPGSRSGRRWLRRGQWVADSVVHGSVVQISGVTGDVEVAVHHERALYRLEEYPDEPPALSVKRAREQPALLLQARYAIVGFTGRAAESARLAAWRDSAGPVSALLLHGAGGQGKTRLAAQFAQASAAAGWRVLQARHATDHAPGPRRDATAQTPNERAPGTLVVVDYAERWPTADLLELCADATRRPHRTRVLLVARPAGVWWQTLSGNELDRLEIETDRLALGPLADEDSTSVLALFTAARDCFAAALDVPADVSADVPAPPPAADAGFREALTVHMAALAAVDARHRRSTEDRPGPALGTPAEVSAYLLTRERAHWQKLHAQQRIRADADAIGQCAYTAALTGPQAHPRALDAIIRAAPGSTGEPPDRLLRDHAVPYPEAPGGEGTTFLEPLQPDRLAEDYLALTTPGHTLAGYTPDPWATDVPRRLLSGVDGPPAWTRNALTVLIAAAQRWPHLVERQLTPLLTARPELALQAGGAALAALSTLPDLPLAVLEAVESRLPAGRHTDLDPGSAALADRLARHRLARTEDPLARARICDGLAERLYYAGLRAEALAAAADAVPVWRDLARADPAAHEASLGSALSNLGVFLSEVGRRGEALAPVEESVGVYRRLAAADPAAYEPRLATALNNLGLRLSEVGRRGEALAPVEESVGVYRRLAAADPAAYEPRLATALNNLGLRLSEVGRRGEALAPAEESVQVHRRLAAANPAAYEPGLASALSSLGAFLSEAGRWEEGLAPTQEAVTVRRRLAAANPAAHERHLALALNNLGIRLSEAGRSEEALAPVREALDVYRRLAAANPAAYEHYLPQALSNLGVFLSKLGHREEAVTPVQESVEVARRLAAADPAVYEPGLALVLSNLGACLSDAGRREEALAPAQEAVAVYRRLAAADPAAYEPNLAMALSAFASGQLPGGGRVWPQALEALTEAVAIFDRLARTMPRAYGGLLRDALSTMADLLHAMGHTSEASRLRAVLSQ
ncbi:tetratricopeptide repeat protein [Streptacidiphilus sp. PB12-B1b]|uniref:tetratricopeptide repeat protein n=1 Tax=Streptacidiphilus sp. PB12-B1b TaxID=2705012 RepID=UPI0015FC38CE|nr:tetratricopeptide repeat protein [Streptacidiphilus sp. PB12-B1b]QMU76518.1 tetratricopeptide repeat protein [Streptacidiphilus sp. PB12-B1b]